VDIEIFFDELPAKVAHGEWMFDKDELLARFGRQELKMIAKQRNWEIHDMRFPGQKPQLAFMRPKNFPNHSR
jgi:hypothetical protein